MPWEDNRLFTVRERRFYGVEGFGDDLDFTQLKNDASRYFN